MPCKFESKPNIKKNRSSAIQSSGTVRSLQASSVPEETPNTGKVGQFKPSSWQERPEKEWIPQFVGSSGDQDPFVLRHCAFNELNYFKRSDWACLRVDARDGSATQFTIVPDSHLDARPTHYPNFNLDEVVKADGPRLLRTYFEVVHLSLPLLDPVYFTKRSKSSSLMQATMYLLSSPFCKNPHVNNVYWPLLTFVQQALPIEARHPKLETVEAALLFLQRQAVYHRAPTTPGLWSDVGSLVGMSQNIGLHVDPTNWDIPAVDRNRRIRVWWMVYIQDKWAALGLGRPSYLNEENCNVRLPTLENMSSTAYEDLTMPTNGIHQFIGMAKLSTILSDVLSIFYSLRASERLKESSSQSVHDLMVQFQFRLESFHNEHLFGLSDIETLLDPTGTIFLAYHTVEISLYRAVLRSLESVTAEYLVVRSLARDVLKKVTLLLQNLTVGRLRSFWWSQMSNIKFAMAGSFMTSMLLTSVDDDEVEYWTSQIKLYQELLETHSVYFATTKLAAARMSVINGSRRGGDDAAQTRISTFETKGVFCEDFRIEFI
ncbi:hypothetical protein BP5796_10837 [Coleophoma crateriformis]|uniref:Xylanolytic transcriptional activator regulatory domain-containing protein n=1 Tax=Coleophoma crateriformis TaxID=565419 RepID=A0A3D8QL53_9HELO|nr:hypothetical protein BP5796_10837 [Coleophoma crateriformis]